MEKFTMEMPSQEYVQSRSKLSNLKANSLKKMDNLKLLQQNSVKLTGSYKNMSDSLKWLCWIRFHLRAIPTDFYMGNLVAVDMSHSCLEEFEPPTVIHTLKILNFKDSSDLLEIRYISRLPNLETLILWNCHSLFHVCETIEELRCLALLNITWCETLCNMKQKNLLDKPKSVDGGRTTQQQFSLPHSLKNLFLKDCNLENSDYFPLTFKDQSHLEYLNLVNSPFELLPSYNQLQNLLVLDLSGCEKLKMLLCLPGKLAELYIYYCNSLERVSFESHQFTLQEFGYEGCVNLSEVEGYFKLVLISKLNETDLGHMKWLKEYQDIKVCLVGDDQLTKGRSLCLQMLYEFNIMSISLPDIKKPNMIPKYEYTSQSTLLSFDVPSCPKNRRLKGLNITFKYTMSGGDWVWFVKISTTNNVDLMYNPKVFGKPVSDDVGIWLSYWPIGKSLHAGDKVDVSIIVMNGLEIQGCGASLVYTDEETKNNFVENSNAHTEIFEGVLPNFILRTGAYYLCRRNFFELMEVDRLIRDWFRMLVGDTIDYTEVGGWRKTGRPEQPYQSYTEVKTVRCIVYGPEMVNVLCNISSLTRIYDLNTRYWLSKLRVALYSFLYVCDSSISLFLLSFY